MKVDGRDFKGVIEESEEICGRMVDDEVDGGNVCNIVKSLCFFLTDCLRDCARESEA